MSKVIFNGIELNGTQVLPELTYAEYDALSVKPEYWILKDDALSEDKVSITASSDTWRTALMKLYALVDISRVNTKSMLGVWESDAIGEKLYTVHVINKKTGQINFTRPTAYTSVTTDTMFIFPNVVYMYTNTSDVSNTSVADGVVFTLYYNTATLGQINTKAKNSIFDPTGTSLSSTNAEDAIKEVDGKIDKGSVSVTADGVKTYGTLLDELYALIDQSKLGVNSWLNASDDTYHRLFRCVNNIIRFTSMESDANSATDLTYNFNLKSSGSQFFINWIESATHDDRSTRVPSNGSKLTVYY